MNLRILREKRMNKINDMDKNNEEIVEIVDEIVDLYNKNFDSL